MSAESAAQAQSGMITIEVVDNPSFWDYAGEYVYVGIIVLFVGLFLWRRWAMRKK
jgi:predicted negative regulator of RcsB-dependent stress response